MKFIFALLFSGSLVFSQAQTTINLTGSWCDAIMQLTADLEPDANVVSWFLDGEELEGESFESIDCHTYGAGLYELKYVQDSETITSTFEMSNEAVPEINFSIASYPAAAVTICENVSIAGEEITSLNWDFGNGEISTEPNPKVFYDIEKEYLIRLSVTTVSGCTYSVSKKHDWSIN